MGNHEFCVDCEESDFHLGRPCDPVKFAAVRRKSDEARIRLDKHTAKAKRLIKWLGKKGIKAALDQQNNIYISKWDL